MPYVEYLASADTAVYASSTFSSSLTPPETATSGSTTDSGEAGCGPFGAYGNYSFSSTTANGSSAGGGQQAQGGLYSYSRQATASASWFSSFNWQDVPSPDPQCTGGELPATNSGSGGGYTNATDSESRQTSFADQAVTISGDSLLSNENQDGSDFSSTIYSFTASWDTSSLAFTGGGTQYVTNNGTTSFTFASGVPNHFLNYKTTITSLEVGLRKTSFENATYYGPLEDSETEYTSIINTGELFTFTSIKTIIEDKPFWSVEYWSRTYSMEWLGYAGAGEQYLGLVYTTTAVSKDISEYATILMETDSFSSTEQNESFAYGASFSGEYNGDTYTLTYDIITTSEVSSQATTLERLSLSVINSFTYGFIKTNTADTTIYTAGTSSQSLEQNSASEGGVLTYETTFFAVSGVSYSYIQAIITTSNFTQFVEISGLNKAESFLVRGLASSTASYTARANAAASTVDNEGNPNGRAYAFAPAFPESSLTLRSPETSNPDTYYTEEASFASFADPNYSSAFNNYSPEGCSLVFLNLVALNDTAEEGKYPSWISVYNGTIYLGNDRAVSSLESVTLNQSSSYVGTGSTNVYQTISYFIGNNTSSATTKTTSISMILQSNASSVSRLIRTKAENLDSAYYNSYLPAIPLVGNDVVYNQGLQSTAGYNINGRLMNAYTTAKSTFAGSQTSSFPISTSGMPYGSPQKNKIRIDKGYNVYPPNNTFQIELLRYSFFSEE